MIIGFPQNPTDLSDVQRGFQVIGAGGIIDGTTLVQDTNGQYKLNADGTTIGLSGGTVAVLAPLAGWKNFIINGNFDIWQRGTTKNTTTSGSFFLADRWIAQYTTTTAIATVAKVGPGPTDDSVSQFSLKVTITTAEAAPAAGNNLFIGQQIEGYNWRHLIGRKVTLSFWVKSTTTGTYNVAIGNPAATYTYLGVYTILAANTWEKKSITFNVALGPIGWGVDNTLGARLRWTLMAGSGFQGTAGDNNANVLKTAGAANLAATLNNTWQLAKVQLEVGPAATTFEWRPFDKELELCQRYFEMSYAQGETPGTASSLGPVEMPNIIAALAASTAGNISPGGMMGFLAPKRANPTMTVYDFDGTAGAMRIQGSVNLKRTGATSFGNQKLSGSFQFISFDNTSTTAIAKNDSCSFHWTADCELG